MTDTDIFLKALEILVQRVKAQGQGVDAVMDILREQGTEGEEVLRVLVEDLFRKM